MGADACACTITGTELAPAINKRVMSAAAQATRQLKSLAPDGATSGLERGCVSPSRASRGGACGARVERGRRCAAFGGEAAAAAGRWRRHCSARCPPPPGRAGNSANFHKPSLLFSQYARGGGRAALHSHWAARVTSEAWRRRLQLCAGPAARSCAAQAGRRAGGESGRSQWESNERVSLRPPRPPVSPGFESRRRHRHRFMERTKHKMTNFGRALDVSSSRSLCLFPFEQQLGSY